MCISKHFSVLLKAITSIDLKCCALIKEDKEIVSINERSFAYELYRCWYKENIDKELIINAEIPKSADNDYFNVSHKIFDKDVQRFEPDLVLHGGQESSEKQEIICEIKNAKNIDNDKIANDLKKLYSYTTNVVDDNDYGFLSHPFKLGVFIGINITPNQIKKAVKEDEFLMSKLDGLRIKCVCVDLNKIKEPIVKDLVELIN